MRKIYLLLPLISVHFLSAQSTSEPSSVSNIMDNIKQIYPAAPTANNLMKFEEVPVNNYTGIPDIKIPIINIPISNSSLAMNVSLNYHPNNAKPSDKASEAGLGWSLFAGGSITRTIRGTPDDQNVVLSFGGQPSIGIYFDEYTSNFLDKNYTRKYLDALETGIGLGTSENHFKKLFYESLYFSRYDTEYDLYQYNFMGYTGRFIVKKDANNKLYVEKLDKNNLRIAINFASTSSSFEINSFIITDEQGNKYTFDIIEKSLRTSLTERVGFKGHTSINTSNLGNVNSAFHLSKITNMGDTELVNFSYLPAQQVIYTNYSQIFRSSKIPVQSNEVQFDREIPAAQETNTQSTTTSVRALQNIEIIGKGKINFSYLHGREDSDFTNPQQLLKLDKISLTNYSGKSVETYQFDYDYFTYRLLGKDIDEKKLSLKKVTKYNSSLVKEFDYVLDYNQNNSGLSLGKDRWDWFNCVKPADNYLLAKDTSPACITTNILKSIKLPSGGIRKFDFGSNTYSYVGNQPIDVYENPDNWENLNTEVTYLKSENRVRKYFFTITSPQKVEFESLANQIANDIWSISIYKKEGNNYLYVTNIGTSVDSGYINYQTRDLDSGEYYVIFNGDFTSNYNGTVNFVATYRDKKVSDIKPYLLGGGIRINGISYFNHTNDVVPAKKVDFKYPDLAESLKSSGALVFPRPVHSYSYDYNNLFISDCSATTPCEQSFNNNFTIYSTENFLPVQKTQGADVGYQNVIVSETNKGESIFTYTSPIDKPNPEQVSSILPPFVAVGNYDYKRGLLKEEKITDNHNVLISKKNNDYLTYDLEKLSGITLRHGGSPFTEYVYAGQFKTYEAYISACVNAVQNPACSRNSIDLIAITNHREIIGKANLNFQEEIKNLNHPVKTKKLYEYNSLDYPIKEKNTAPDGTIKETIYSYAHEKGNQLLIDKNMIGIPLETTTTQTIGSATKTLSRAETIYPLNQSEANTKSSGLVLPLSVISYDNLNGNPSTEVTYDQYDLKGNIQQYTTKSGIPVAIVWGYNGTQPIAKIEGATYAQVQSLATTIITASDTDAAATPNNDETNFLNTLKTFRAGLPNYQITTYTYDPLIGVRSITPPSGIREVYLYDSANRLMEIREQNQTGKLLKEFKYNYKN